ncbi:benzoate 4-monooxygenase cytochrome-like protein P450, partial [Aaosphaeria arxii CBS 175.79]
VTVIIYRIRLHPLSKYPGPYLARFTDWYSVYHCALGDRHIDFYRLHQRYGPIVRYGPHRISINTNTALRDVYHVRANVQRSTLFNVFSHFFKVSTVLTTISRKVHVSKRRIMTEALNATTMKGTEEVTLENIRFFCDRMLDASPEKSREWSSGRNMTLWCGWLLTDISGDAIFHKSWNMLRSTENRDIFHILGEGAGGLVMVGHMPDILKLKIDRILFRKATEGTYKYQKVAAEQSDWRLQQAENIKDPDIFGSLMNTKDPETGRSLTREELIGEAGFLIIAGSDTTASAVTATIFYLLHYPQCLEIARKEVDQHFPNIEDIRSGESLTACKYLYACITEAMRLCPSVGGITPREVMDGGIVIDNQEFPAGTELGVPHYALQHMEEYFPQPFSYVPTRWLLASQHEDGVPLEEWKLANSAFAAFGVGRTQCIGKVQAYSRAMTIIARLLRLFDMRLDPDSSIGEGNPVLGEGRHRKNEFQTWDQFTSRHDGPMVQFRPR